MNKISKKTWITILIGCLLWIIFLFQEEFSNYGIYTLFGYRTHEILTLIPFFLFIGTIVWLIKVIVVGNKEKAFAKNRKVILLLGTILIAQFFLIRNYVSSATTSTIAKVVKVDSLTETIVIENDGTYITLDCAMPLYNLLMKDQEYLITYTHPVNNPYQ